jgi:alkylhydroperoxidase family enzyme
MRRLDPPALASLPKPVSDLLALASGPDGEPLGTIAVLAHCPPLLGPFLGWAAALAVEGALSPRHHEILALRAAFNCQSAFEWSEHVAYGRRAGLDDGEIARLGLPAEAGGWAEGEAALIRAVDGLIANHSVDDDTWAVLARHYGDASLVEIVYVVGQYTMLSMVANGLEIPPATNSEPLPARRP